MGKLKTYQEQLQDIVEKGINAAEEQQKKLAAKPFEYAEKLESEARNTASRACASVTTATPKACLSNCAA